MQVVCREMAEREDREDAERSTLLSGCEHLRACPGETPQSTLKVPFSNRSPSLSVDAVFEYRCSVTPEGV